MKRRQFPRVIYRLFGLRDYTANDLSCVARGNTRDNTGFELLSCITQPICLWTYESKAE